MIGKEKNLKVEINGKRQPYMQISILKNAMYFFPLLLLFEKPYDFIIRYINSIYFKSLFDIETNKAK